MSKPNVNKRTASVWLDTVSPSGETCPCQHGEIYNCGDVFNLCCGFCDTLNAVSKRNVAAASSFTCAKCHESISNNGSVISVDGFVLVRLYNPLTGSFDSLNGYISSVKKPQLQRQTGVYIPQPPLVGIEPNPGPKQQAIVVKAKAFGPKTLAQTKKAERRRKKNKMRRQMRKALHPLLAKHYRNVLDPFNYPAVLHSLDSNIEPTKFTAINTGTLALNADGSGFIFCFPNLVQTDSTSTTNLRANYISTQNAGTATATFVGVSAPNRAVVAAAQPIHKTVSSAIRVTPLLAATAAPGIITGGLFTHNGSLSLSTLAVTPSAIANYPTFKRLAAVSTQQYIVNWSPDTANHDLEYYNTGHRLATDRDLSNGMVISFTGFPASSSVMYEVITHGEGYLNPYQNTAAVIEYPSVANKDKLPSIGEIGITNPSHLYDPPGHFIGNNPYSEMDEKQSNSSKNIFSQVSEAYNKASGILQTAEEIADAVSIII
jgi:hypothetical protein